MKYSFVLLCEIFIVSVFCLQMILIRTYLPLLWVDTEPFPSSSSFLSSCPVPPPFSCFQMGFDLFKVGPKLTGLQLQPPSYWDCRNITIPGPKASQSCLPPFVSESSMGHMTLPLHPHLLGLHGDFNSN